MMEIEMESQQDNTKALYEASMRGCVTTLNTLLQRDPLLLDRISLTSYTETPLHISSLLGHVDFIRALLHSKPDLSSQLNSQKQSPLHLASAEGHIDVVQALLSVNNEACLVPDQFGRVPVHLGAIRGRAGVIRELIGACPRSVRVKLNGNETILRLCARYNHLEALQMLVAIVGRDVEFLNSEDSHGNTIFQLATALKQVETIKYLISVPEIKVEADALTAMFTDHPLDPKTMPIQVSTITSQTIRTTKKRNKDQNNALPQQRGVQKEQVPLPPTANFWGRYVEYQGDWLEKTRGNLMLVATLIATIAFQAATNPPSGLWDHDGCPPQLQGKACEPGTSVFAYTQNDIYYLFILCNTISFSASLSIMLLLVSGFPLRNRFSMWILMAAMCFTIFFTAASYLISVRLVGAPEDGTIAAISTYYVIFWAVLLAIVVLFYVISFLVWLVRKMLACAYCIIVFPFRMVKQLHKLMKNKPSSDPAAVV